mgnify:CR=1 FL=1
MNDNRSQTGTGDVLVVDDTPANLKLLVEMLSRDGYKARLARNGQAALAAARARVPDLILLDISMPGMDGFQVCEALKDDPDTREVPVIFISALSDTLDKVRAFSAGGVDYITKPFQWEEVAARVRTHLELKRAREALGVSNAELNNVNGHLTRLIAVLAHDLRNPLSGFMNYPAELLDGLEDGDLSHEQLAATLEQMETEARAVYQLLEDLLTWGQSQLRQDTFAPESLELRHTVAVTLDTAVPLARRKRLTLGNAVPEHHLVHADRAMLTAVIRNLVGNAIKFTPAGGIIVVEATTPEPGWVEITVQDTGQGLSAERRDRLFAEPASTPGTAQERGRGIGLVLCREFVERHGGEIRVDSTEGQGSRFRFSIPAAAG